MLLSHCHNIKEIVALKELSNLEEDTRISHVIVVIALYSASHEIFNIVQLL